MTRFMFWLMRDLACRMGYHGRTTDYSQGGNAICRVQNNMVLTTKYCTDCGAVFVHKARWI